MTSHEHSDAWLAEHAGELGRWRERIHVRHDPALTMRVILSARGIAAGRRALGSLRAADVARIVRRYREEYRSSLLSSREVVAWLQAALGTLIAPPPDAGPPRRSKSSIPLYFPSRVTLHLRDGGSDAAQVDLPVGAFCSPTVEEELRNKFVRESAEILGQERAEAAFAMGLSVDATPLADFVRACSPAQAAAEPPSGLSRSQA
jgi:hypothetical protein